MAVKINNNSYSKFYLDGDEVSKIYLNSSLVYTASSGGGDEPSGWEEWEKDLLTFTALEATDITLSPNRTGTTYPTVYYKKDSDSEYTQMTSSTTISLNSDEEVKFYGNNIRINTGIGKYVSFTSTGRFKTSGKVTSLLSSGGTDPTTATTYNYVFACLFRNCIKLVSAKDLVLPGVISPRGCIYMFADCTNLETAPSLPATTLANSCYERMFWRCSSLVNPPSLPATTLADYCYKSMFASCTNLETAPSLPATTLASSCYSDMFGGCSSLVNPPSLPATTLTDGCYSNMFNGCKKLTTAPSLPVTTLADRCYYYMFKDCKALTSLRVGFSTISGSSPLTNWLNNITTIGVLYAPSGATYSASDISLPRTWTLSKTLSS